MHLQAIDFKEFYETIAGRVVQRLLRQHLRRFWPHQKGLRLLSVGYAQPFLRPFMDESESVTVLMSRETGAVFWPPDDKGRVGLCAADLWPVETNSVDRLLLVHALTSYENNDALLREAHRVLKAQGSLVLIVPNRTGLWAKFDTTPFGYGVPYSMGQLRQLLRDYGFVPERAERGLFLPPTRSRVMLSFSYLLENIGSRFFNAFGGVNIAEATKQLYAGIPAAQATAEAQRQRLLTSPRPLSRMKEQ